MAIVAECPACGKRFKAAESQAGKKAKCSQCAQVFVIGQERSEAGKLPGTLPTPARPTTPAPAKTKPVSNPADTPAVAGKIAPQTKTTPLSNPAVRTQTAAATAQPAPSPSPTIVEAPVSAAPAARTSPDPATVVTPAPAPKAASAAAPKTAAKAPAKPKETVDDLVAKPEKTTEARGPRTRPAPAEKTGRGWMKWAIGGTLAAGLAVVGILFGPQLMKQFSGPAKPAPTRPVVPMAAAPLDPLPAITIAIPPATAAWTTQPDATERPLALNENYKLEAKVRDGSSPDLERLAISSTPGSFVAIPARPDDNPSDPGTIEIWSFTERLSMGTVKPGFRLSQLAVSPEGAFVGGQYHDDVTRQTRVEIYATRTGAKVHTTTLATPTPLGYRACVGFPSVDKAAILGDRKLKIVDLKNDAILTETEIGPISIESKVAASAMFKYVAIADTRSLHLVEVPSSTVCGTATIPEVVTAHPRKALSLRAMKFSPDGRELALMFDNRQSARRIAIYEVTTGKLKDLLAPTAPVESNGIDLEWLNDGSGFVVGGGIVIDRATSRQAGAVNGDPSLLMNGGAPIGLLADRRAVFAGAKAPNLVVFKSVKVDREDLRSVEASILSAQTSLLSEVECVAPIFGNDSFATALHQRGQLTDHTLFLAVKLKYSLQCAATLAPMVAEFRSDQFTLLADGQVRPPIGTLENRRLFRTEKPEHRVTRGQAQEFERTVVFVVSGRERNLAIQVGSARRAMQMPSKEEKAPTSEPASPRAEELKTANFNAPDDTSAVTVRIKSVTPGRNFQAEPELEGDLPLQVTYSAPSERRLVAVNFDVTFNAPRSIANRAHAGPPKIGLLLPDGTHVLPAAILPRGLPQIVRIGETGDYTALFVLGGDPSQLGSVRFTCDSVPVATIQLRPGSPAVGSTP